jgi:hypothetical protein
VPEPGKPPGDSSPLFQGFKSYSTLDDVKAQLPDRSTWTLSSDSTRSARADCARFDQFTFAVHGTHLGHQGSLRLDFINDRLQSTSFVPQDFPAYIDALRRSGLEFGADGRATVPPYTTVWQGGGFVAWADTRFQEQTKGWIFACS